MKIVNKTSFEHGVMVSMNTGRHLVAFLLSIVSLDSESILTNVTCRAAGCHGSLIMTNNYYYLWRPNFMLRRMQEHCTVLSLSTYE